MLVNPLSLTILPTYTCTAACPSCSLECSPLVKSPRIPIENLIKYIEEAKNTFETLKIVVFSGGECTLIGEDLIKAIECVSNVGLLSRIVTNGSWAASETAISQKVKKFIKAGLTEINFSTGDEHAMFVPIENIIKAAIYCAQNGIRTAISVEGHLTAALKGVSIMDHELIMKYYAEDTKNTDKLIIFNNVWMDIDKRTSFKQNEYTNRFSEYYPQSEKGCNNVLRNIVINPEEQLCSCCGLTFENINEMKLGSLKDYSMLELYQKQINDFLKLWVHIEGPEEIIKFAKSKNDKIECPKESGHICEACVYMYQNNEIRNTLKEYYTECINDVLFKIELRNQVFNHT